MSWTTWGPEQWLSDPPMPATWGFGADEWENRIAFMVRSIRSARAERDDQTRQLATARAGNERRHNARAWRAANGFSEPTKAEREAERRRAKAAEVPEAPEIIDAYAGYDPSVAALLRRLDKDEELERRREEARAIREAEARTGVHISTPPPPDLSFSTLKVGEEPAVYGPGSSWSYFRDLYIARTHTMGAALPSRRVGEGFPTVCARLGRHNRQMQRIARTGPDDGRALLRNYFVERNRPWHGTVSDRSQEAFRHLIFGEHRDDSTAATSLGSFAPPVYLLQQWLQWRTAAAPAAARAAQRPLPPTGMTVDIPGLTSGVAMGVQATENDAVTSSTPTAAYRSAPVLTIAGSVSISQQALDRFGVSADEIIAEQAARQAATALDAEVLTAIVAAMPTSHKITDTGTAGVPSLWADVAEATSKLTTSEGTRLSPDTVLMPPLNAAWFRAQTDKQTRPVWLPSAAGVAARVGPPTTSLEGFTGYDVQGACVYEDANLEPTTTHATLLVGAFGRGALVLTGTPIVDVWPETDAAALTAVVTIRQYVAVVVQYSSAFARISGSAYAKTPSFTGA